MKHWLTLAFTIGALTAGIGPSFGEIYSWEDQEGVIGFTDRLEKVPPEYRDSSNRIEEVIPPASRINPLAPTRSRDAEVRERPDPYQLWRNRIGTAQEQLEELRSQRQQAEDEFTVLRRQLWYQWGFVDPGAYSDLLEKIQALDDRIRQKESEIDTTIPDEARRSNVPPGALRP